MLSTVLIIDKRKELPIKYKKSIEDNFTTTVIAKNMKDAFCNLQILEPDMIIVSDSIDENLAGFCEKIRTLTYNTRPIIIALSKSADVSDRIVVLEKGADDFISEPVNIDEFTIRIKAHLRRDIESNLDTDTLLPNKKITFKTLKRILNSERKQATLLIGLDNMPDYISIYTKVAGDKIIKTLISIIKSSISDIDFIGQLDETNFIVTTGLYNAEKFAEFIIFAFDSVITKFYSKEDAERGYILLKGERHAEMRSNFVSVTIGGILDNYNIISDVNDLLAKLFLIKKHAKQVYGSGYMIDRIKIAGEYITSDETNNTKTIYLQESDKALYTLLRTTLELQGYDVTEELNKSLPPQIIILDSESDLSGLEFCQNIRKERAFANSKIIVTTNTRNKAQILDAGADLYLPKPYEIFDLIKWVKYFL